MMTRQAARYGVVLAVAALLGACVDEQPTAPRAGLDPASEALFARGKAGGRGLDAELSRIASEAPGFGGMYYDASGRLNVHVTRDRMSAKASRDAIVASVGRSLRGRGRAAPPAQEVVFHEAEHDFLRLSQMRDRMLPLLGVEGVVYTDVDETTNRLRVGVVDGTSRASIEAALGRVGVPVDMVTVQATPAVERLKGETLRDLVQPVGGGVQIVWEYGETGSYFLCTLGFNVLRDEPGRSQPYFITNSHCTGDQGVVTGTEYYQASPFADAFNVLGVEVLDPPFFTDPCYIGYVCRWSDAALVRYHTGNPVRFGSIYRTESVSANPLAPGSIDIVDGGRKFFSITDERPFAMVGEVLDKMGRTSGWTRGVVAATCADYGVSGTNYAMLCQDVVLGYAAGGDSGSPVFRPTSDRNATLYGVLWGGGPGIFVYSPMENIRFELGDFTTH